MIKAKMTQLIDHSLVLFVAGTIAVALLLVGVSMKLYYSSDASRVDLSRPEYRLHRAEIDDRRASASFDAQGPIDAKTVTQFLQQYNQAAEKVTNVAAFSNDVLSDAQLGLDKE